MPRSTHPNGSRYEWLHLPAEIPAMDVKTAGFLEPFSDATESNREHRDNGGTRRTTEAIERGGVGNRKPEKTKTPDRKPETGDFVDRAILESLPTGPGRRNKQVFGLARALKAVPAFADAHVDALKPRVRQ